MTTLLSIDPGGAGTGHTGIVRLWYTPTEAPLLLESWAVPDGLDGWLAWHDEYRLEDHWIDLEVVCEHFVNRNVPGADLTPCFIEGSVRTVYRDVILQPAAGKNTAVPDTVLKRLGLYSFPGDHHHDRREAARHALWYLKKQKHIPTLKAMYPE